MLLRNVKEIVENLPMKCMYLKSWNESYFKNKYVIKLNYKK